MLKTKRFLLAPTLFALSAAALAYSAPIPVYRDRHQTLEQRVIDIMHRLTLEEKMDLLTGTDFTTRPVPRLGIPPVVMADAGQGVRGGPNSTLGRATAFPSAVAMASSWNPTLVHRVAAAIGEEAKNKGTGIQIMLGPAVNIHRSPLGGRNGEYFSEDPYLAARLAVAFVQGMQGTGVVACLKHFAANNEEVDRDFVNVSVGERALREIYLPAFEAGVKEGHAWTVMSSYNMVNGYHSSANKFLLTDVLKKDWGFDGMVMSDWGGVHEISRTVNSGNDLEMPGPGMLKRENIEKAYRAGEITGQAIEENVRRIIRTVVRSGVLDGLPAPDHSIVNSKRHQDLAYESALEGIVLLKNDKGILPLNKSHIRSVALIGPGAKGMQVDALGSPQVEPFYTIQPFDGIKSKLLPGAIVRYSKGIESGAPVPSAVLFAPDGTPGGLQGDYFANKELAGTPALTRKDSQIQFTWTGTDLPNGLGKANYSVRWTGKLLAPATGNYLFSLTTDDGCRMWINGKQIIDHWVDQGESTVSGSAKLEGGKSYDIRIEYYQAAGDAVVRLSWMVPSAKRFAEAVKVARASDVAIVCVSTLGQEGEGTDRPSMDLPSNQDDLIAAVCAANPNTVVVLNNGTPVGMTHWLGKVHALVESWFPGQEGGHALASILFGDANPSGKLPDTLAAKREDYPDFGNFPGKAGQVNYKEGIYVGYRRFDKWKIAPLFPFGYGLSYTTFKYTGLSVSKVSAGGTCTVSLRVTNTGKRSGSEVIELYVHDQKPKMDKPVQELKGFRKIKLAPGETKSVQLSLNSRDFSYFEPLKRVWRADAGSYEIRVGASSRDIRSKVSVKLAKTLIGSVKN